MKTGQNYSEFEKLFRQKTDPWEIEKSTYEKERFAKTLELLKTVTHKKVLEIGCAEGHFTKLLTNICKDVTAIDVSEEAIKRAKERAPRAKYIKTSIDNMDTSGQKFDVVIAAEVLYYIKDKKAVFEKIKKVAKYLLMCNFRFTDFLSTPQLRDATLVKAINYFKLKEGLKFCRISLWRLDRFPRA